MRVQQCEHPKRVWNSYDKEFVYVPCGKCPSCQKNRVNKWIERLNVERKCWKYCVFFTLTYSNDFVPRLKRLGDTSYFADLSHLHQAPSSPCVVIDTNEIMSTLSDSDKVRFDSYLRKNEDDGITYLSVYDAQLFIKRLRKNLYNTIKFNYADFSEADTQVRYYLIGEYGSTLYRSHMHGVLWFSSDKEATHIEECIRKSWKLGITDSSFVAESDSVSSYVSKYLNSFASLPPILQHPSIRQFSIFSKSVPLGTLYFNEEKVQEIFYNASPRLLVDYFKGVSVTDVPLWRTYQDRLFPKLSGYSKLTRHDRIILYRAFANFKQKYGDEVSSPYFVDFMLEHHESKRFTPIYLHCYDDYLSFLMDRCKYMGDYTKQQKTFLHAIKFWYFCSSRVVTQAAAFGCTIEEYVDQIDLFYQNLDHDKLIGYFDFQREYCKEHPASELLGMDKLWLESILDVPFFYLDASECEQLKALPIQLEGYGIDIEKFYSPIDAIRIPYQCQVLPENTRDYQNMVIDNAAWLKRATKNKVKNDYLMSHPDDLLKVSDYVPF